MGAEPADVHTKTFPTPPDSWQVVFVEQNLPDGKSNKGRVQAYDGPIYIADAALFVKATQPQLGISDPYQLTEEQYQAVLKVLRAQHSLIHRYWHDTTVQMSDFKTRVWLLPVPGHQANALKAEGQPVATVFPKEGVTGWADTTMLLYSEAKHPVCAYKWMNWSLTPKVQGDVAAVGSLPVVPEGCKASPLLGEKGCETNGFNYFDKIAFWKTPIAEGGKFVPAVAGRRITLPLWAVANFAGCFLTYAVKLTTSRGCGDVRAVDGVGIAIKDGEFFSMLGPSGSGKTTCLRLIAGFEQLSGGAVYLW